MKKFFSEFKTFITRGNVLDMAVGVIVGGAFTAIVNGLSDNILKPIINWILALVFGADSLSEVYTVLKAVYAEDGLLDLTQSIYIDWGAFINAIVNFFLIALVLFSIVKLINKISEERKELFDNIIKQVPTSADKKEMKALGIKRSDKAAVEKFYADKAKAVEEAKRIAEERANAERETNPTTEDLLKEICRLLKEKN